MLAISFLTFAMYFAIPLVPSPPTPLPPVPGVEAPPVAAKPLKQPEVREHYKITSTVSGDDFAVTEIQWLSEARDKTVTLVEAHDGSKYVYRWEWDYEHQVTTCEFGEAGSDNNIKLTSWKPFNATARATTIAEARKNPAMMSADFRFEIVVGKDPVVIGMMSFWKDVPTQRQWRSSVRQALSSSFLERMEMLDSTGLFALPSLGAVRVNLVSLVLYRTYCAAPERLTENPAVPDCRFDKSFGFGCSETQEARAKLAANAKTPHTGEY
jgi:hypothetical protein